MRFNGLSETSTTDVGDNSYREKESNNSKTTANIIRNDYTVSGTVSGYDLNAGNAVYECSCGQTKYEKIYIDRDALVYRLSGSTRYDTAFKAADCLKEVLGVSKFDSAVIATGKNFADALSGSYLAYVNEAPMLLTNGKNVDDVKDYIKKNVKTGGTIYLLVGTGAVPSSMESGMSSCEVIRLAGENRYETNLLILEEAGVDNQELVVCTGKNYADSLSASAVKKPILLVKTNITDEHKELFLDNEVENFYIIGGTGAVSERVQMELEEYGIVDRIYGDTRYETSAEVAEYFFESADAAVLAYGKNFPDGLCGGPLACGLNGPLILTASDKTSFAKKYTKAYSIEQGYVLGGTGLISDAATRTIFNKSSNNTILLY